MKEILLSFKTEYFKTLLYGVKKYEYRKRFCKEQTKAYLYLSGKAKQIVGFLELGSPIRLDLTRNDYIDYPETLKRVDEYIANGDINAIPIKSLTLFEHPIHLEDIRKEIPGFMPPQMYYILKENTKIKKMLDNRRIGKKIVVHEHDEIYYDNLALSISELEKTIEFKTKDK